jgi:hypothetical protein
MTIFEYLLVLISIIVGLGLTHILGGVGRIVSHLGRRKVYWVHLLWVGWAFIWLILFWWFQFQRSRTELWTPTDYLFLVLFAVAIYLFCVILLPGESPDGVDYRRYYYSRRRWIFGLWLAVMWFNLFENLNLLDWSQNQVIGVLFLHAAITGLGLIAAFSTKERFHAALGVAWIWASLRDLLWGDYGPQAIDGIDPSPPMWNNVVSVLVVAILLVATLSVFISPLDKLLDRFESGVLKRKQ